MRLILLFSLAYILGGCVAKSSAVDLNNAKITDLATLIKKHHPKDKHIDDLISKAVADEIRGSALVNKEQLVGIVNKAAKLGGAATGFPLESVVAGGIALLGIGAGGSSLAGRKKRQDQLAAMGKLDPEEAEKVSGVM